MRDLAVLTFLTLDGVMTLDGLSWSAKYFDDVMQQVNEEAMAQPFDLLFGRKTYETFAAYWPNAEKSAHSDKLNNSTKYVVTSSLSNLEWENSIAISGDIPSEISRLKKENGPLLQVHGSWQLIQTLLSNNLVDEFRLWIFPVVLGEGKRLFDQGAFSENLTLVKTGSTSNGVVMCIYRRTKFKAD